jgi:hypothetical protein
VICDLRDRTPPSAQDGDPDSTASTVRRAVVTSLFPEDSLSTWLLFRYSGDDNACLTVSRSSSFYHLPSRIEKDVEAVVREAVWALTRDGGSAILQATGTEFL